MLCHINTEFKNSGDLSLEGSVPARLGAIIFAFGKEMLTDDSEEVERKSDFLEDCSQFTSKRKRSTSCCTFQQAKCCADQENVGEGSEILKRGVSRIFEQANERIYGLWDTQPRRLSFRGKVKGIKAKQKQHSKRKKGNVLITRKVGKNRQLKI